MEANGPAVSIIVRTKDRPKLLKRALGSIKAQTYRPAEVVLVNDGGCELDIGILKAVLDDISLNYVRLEENRGRAPAGNIGIENAAGQYIGFLDDDDEFCPDHIETLVGFLDGSDYKVAYTDADIIRSRYDPLQKRFVDVSEGVLFSENFSPHSLLFENYIPLICLLIDKGVFESTGMFDERFELFEDWDLLIRISRVYSFQHVACITAKYYQWSNDFQIAHSDPVMARKRYLDVLMKHEAERTSEVAYQYFLTKQEQFRTGTMRIKNLMEEELRNRDEEIQKRNNELGRVREELREKEDGLEQTREKLGKKEEELGSTRDEFGKTREEFLKVREALGEKLSSKEDELRNISAELQRTREELLVRNAYIEEVQTSVGWMALEWYRRNVKSLVAPVGSGRWRVYHKALKGFRTLKRDGAQTFVGKVRRHVREVKSSSAIKNEVFSVPVLTEERTDNLSEKISVVIPTKNGGRDFQFVLDKIRGQRGIDQAEIIVVDSGSEDDTIALARRYGAKVISIDSVDFGHGRTRTFGAEHASGDYLIFLSQDAIPIGDTCFADIIRGMKNDPGIAAVSAKQVARSDADLFACWQIWNHYENFLRYSEDKVVSVDNRVFETLGPEDKRRVAQLDNIFSCIRKDVFDKFKFADLQYAEDLDLGMRLIESGYKIGFLSSVGVIHSHNRDAGYYFRRSYVDRRMLIRLVRFEPVNWHSIGVGSPSEMTGYIRDTYLKLDFAFRRIRPDELGSGNGEFFLSSVPKYVQEYELQGGAAGNDPALNDVIDEISAAYGCSEHHVAAGKDVMMQQFLSILESFRMFLASYETLEHNFDEVISSLYELCGVVLGANCGDFVAFHEGLPGQENVSGLAGLFGNQV